MPGTVHYPPPSRPEQRYDAVVARGERLRRRARTRTTLVTSGVAALAVLAIGVGVLAARGGTTRSDPVAPSSTTTAAPSDELGVSASYDDSILTVDVDDGSVPMGDATQACAHVRLLPEGAAQMPIAVGTACWYPADGGAVTETPMWLTNGVDVGCAAAEVHPDDRAPTPAATGPLQHSFRFALPADVPTGTYVAEVVGVTGIGDGCPTSGPDEAQDSADAKAAVAVP